MIRFGWALGLFEKRYSVVVLTRLQGVWGFKIFRDCGGPTDVCCSNL